MDSKRVNQAIRHQIRPLLEAADFTQFTARSAWRYTETRIEVLNFQSFNAYLAASVGCTTYSFSVNLATFLTAVPPLVGPDRIKEKAGRLRPQEYECHLRGRLRRSFSQPELSRRDIWYIDPAGTYLAPALADVAKQIERVAWPWFERLRDDAWVLDLLQQGSETNAGVYGFGADPSPVRSLMTGFMALALGRHDLARAHVRQLQRGPGSANTWAGQLAAAIADA